jgi:hypothetical protein
MPFDASTFIDTGIAGFIVANYTKKNGREA